MRASRVQDSNWSVKPNQLSGEWQSKHEQWKCCVRPQKNIQAAWCCTHSMGWVKMTCFKVWLRCSRCAAQMGWAVYWWSRAEWCAPLGGAVCSLQGCILTPLRSAYSKCWCSQWRKVPLAMIPFVCCAKLALVLFASALWQGDIVQKGIFCVWYPGITAHLGHDLTWNMWVQTLTCILWG